MIKVRYLVSGAVLRADVEGVGPNVVLKQMYYRDRLDLSWARNQLASLPPSPLSLHYLTHFKDAHLEGGKSCIFVASCLDLGIVLLLLSYMQPVTFRLCFLVDERRERRAFFFLTHPFTSHNVVFVSFWQFIQTSALWEWQAISQTTERVAAKGNKPGPTLRFSPGWLTSSRDSISHVLIKISKVVTLHLPPVIRRYNPNHLHKKTTFPLSRNAGISSPKNCLSF